jgi:hypothetical protein
MPICQNCGKNIAANETIYRREIYSGRSQRVNYGKRITFGNSNHYSVKNVCESCAESIDNSRKNSNNTFLIIVALIVLSGLLYYALKH